MYILALYELQRYLAGFAPFLMRINSKRPNRFVRRKISKATTTVLIENKPNRRRRKIYGTQTAKQFENRNSCTYIGNYIGIILCSEGTRNELSNVDVYTLDLRMNDKSDWKNKVAYLIMIFVLLI